MSYINNACANDDITECRLQQGGYGGGFGKIRGEIMV